MTITILVIDFSHFFPLLPLSFFEMLVYPLLLQNCLSRCQSDLRVFLKLPTLSVPASDAVTRLPSCFPFPGPSHFPFCLPLTLPLPSPSLPPLPSPIHPLAELHPDQVYWAYNSMSAAKLLPESQVYLTLWPLLRTHPFHTHLAQNQSHFDSPFLICPVA